MDNFQLDHVGIAVSSIAASAPVFCQITGTTLSPIEELAEMEVNVAFVGSIELIEPRSHKSPVYSHIQRHGSALHHIAYSVYDIELSLKNLPKLGFQLIDEKPRLGAKGHQVAFIQPKDTDGILIELVQRAHHV
ncbi:MAG TPA: methylmalonyl-CoA epimerase [Gemmatimonadetes bacterium]|jgi:methylmalonyl-CoA/ethylmalonyl-CoA epimerase|nr:methylmalonyl-CoA epimerase [Gemmatimonadota bacterium]